MKAIYWRLFIIRLALRWVGRPNLGDEVIYQGKRWTLNQGVEDPYWSLARDDEYLKRVHRNEFHKVRGLKSAWCSFQSGYRFYMRSWYSIWLHEGVKPWMLGCKIWAGKPPGIRSHG